MATTWLVSGQVQVAVDETTESRERVRGTFNVAGIEVEVFGSLLNSGGFASWGKTTTNSNGEFSLSESIAVFPEKPRHRRVKARFSGKNLEVSTGTLADAFASDWYTVYQSDSKHERPTINISRRVFRSVGGGDLGSQRPYRQATAWFVCTRIMDELVRRDAWFAFKKKITMVYPANVVSGVPYANGVTRCAYIHHKGSNDWWTLDTLIHEMMHLWNWDHNSGTSNWLQAICDGDTHSFQEKPAIAFHEGFAEYAKDDILHEIFGTDKVEPLNRHSYRNGRDQALTSLAVVEGSDDGVINALHLLTTPNIYTRTFGTRASTTPAGTTAGTTSTTGGTCPTPPNLTFWDVLRVFKPAPESGWKTAWQVGTASYGIVRFFERASDILRNFDTETKDVYLALIDPSSTVEPQSRCS